MKAIFFRELKSYYDSMTGWIVCAFIIAITGIYFFVYNLYYGYPYFSYTLVGVSAILMFIIPILTMRSFAEERKTKTDQMLLTAPISVGQIVCGKFLAMVCVFLLPLLVLCVCPLIIKANGNAYLVVDYCTIAVFFLYACCFISVGMFISSLTESQIIAAVGAYGACFLLLMWHTVAHLIPQTSVFSFLTDWMDSVTLSTPLSNFGDYYIFDVDGIVLYLSFIFIFIFLTIQTIKKRRWS